MSKRKRCIRCGEIMCKIGETPDTIGYECPLCGLKVECDNENHILEILKE